MSAVHVTIYTDGGCKPNPGHGGWATILKSGPRSKTLSGGCRHTTNNRMELRAVIEGFSSGRSRRADWP
jgi:ribonuclease HI